MQQRGVVKRLANIVAVMVKLSPVVVSFKFVRLVLFAVALVLLFVNLVKNVEVVDVIKKINVCHLKYLPV